MDFISFKEIESQVSDDVLEHIKNDCYERVFSHSELTKIEKTKTGTRYRSLNVYKTVFNENKYTRLVRQYFIEHIHQEEVKPSKKTSKKEAKKEQNKVSKTKIKKRKKKEIGKNITQREFFEHIFRDLFDNRRGEEDTKGRRIYLKSFFFDMDKELRLINEQKVASNLEKAIAHGRKYGHFTPALFISHRFFTKEMLSLLGVIVLDFDLDKTGIFMTKEQLYKHIKTMLQVEPAMIWDTSTKGNYQAAILIEKMVGTPKSIHLYEQIVKEMIHKLGDICDKSAWESNHSFAIGRNNIREGKYIRFYSNEVHSINKFRWLLDERDQRRQKETKVIDFKEVSIRKHPAITALLEGDVYWRDHACFTAALVLRFLGKDEIEAETFLLTRWLSKVNNANYDHPFTEREVLKCTKHAYSGNYRSFHSSWVEICTGLECNLKGYFRPTYESKGIYQTDTKDLFVAFMKKNNGFYIGTKKSLAEELGVKYETLKKIIENMRKENELSYPTVRGQGKQTPFTLIEKAASIPVISIEEFKTTTQRINEIHDLETIVNDLVSLQG
ncbi:TPA: hypothetical protein QCW55_005637 [Bacillus cereus]|nr:hypothetical protein [Bacillus cereus]